MAESKARKRAEKATEGEKKTTGTDGTEASGLKIGRFRINLSRLPELLLLFVIAGILLGGAFKYFFDFHPEAWGRWTHFDSYFSKGLVKPPISFDLFLVGVFFLRILPQ